MEYLKEFWWTAEAYLTYIEPNMCVYILAIAVAVWSALCLVQKVFTDREVQKGREKSIKQILLAIEIALILWITLSGREQKDMAWQWVPFTSWKWIIVEKNMAVLAQIFANILLFVPLGFLLPYCIDTCRKYCYAIFYSFLLSFAIELIQGIVQIGLFETDDIIHNVLGASIGFGLFRLLRRLNIKRVRRSKKSV